MLVALLDVGLWCWLPWCDLTDEQRAELRTLTNSPGVAATVATRARIMLWHIEGVHGC
jgi:hypothetical protein